MQASLIHGNLSDFFNQLLLEAAATNSERISPLALDYVSKVLVHFHESNRFFIHEDSKVPILADLLAASLEADLYRRISLLRQLGDTALMLSGVFFEALERKSVDLSYYHQMGETAYSHLGNLSERESVFGELSDRFGFTVELVRDVFDSLKVQGLSTQKLLELADQKESKAALRELQKLGIYPFGKGIE